VDLLSDVIASMRIGRAHSALVRRTRPFVRRSPASEGAGFHVVVRGSAWFIPADGAPLALGTGDVVFLPNGSAHTLADSLDTPIEYLDPPPTEMPAPTPDWADEPEAHAIGAETLLLCGAYLLDRTHPHPLIGGLPDVIHIPARLGDRSSVRAVTDLLATELQSENPGREAMIAALLDTLLLHLLRTWISEHADPDGSPWAAALADPAVSAALDAIHTDPLSPWTVDGLAARARLSRASFSARFSALVGRPPIAYLTWWRLSLAARELRRSDATIATVAARTGYASEFAFANAFKREFGVAPGRFRRAATTTGDSRI